MSDIDHLRKMEIKNSYLNDKKINIKNLFDER